MANPLPVANYVFKSTNPSNAEVKQKKHCEIKPVSNNGWDLYDLGQFQAAYAWDLPITVTRRVYMPVSGWTETTGRIMGISREGSNGYHIVEMQDISGSIQRFCIRTAIN